MQCNSSPGYHAPPSGDLRMDQTYTIRDLDMKRLRAFGVIAMALIALLSATRSRGQSPALEIGDEKEPKLRAELLQLLRDDQTVRAEFEEYRKRHGLLDLDAKTLSE